MTVKAPSDLVKEIRSADNVTLDLARKVADDVGAAIRRVLDVAPPGSLLPIAMAAGASVMAALSICLDKEPKREGPDPETLLFAGLLLGRMVDRESEDEINSAYRDLAILKADHGETRTKAAPERDETKGAAQWSGYRGFRITTIHAICGIDPDDDQEGIPAISTPDGAIPLIASDHVRLDAVTEMAQAIADATGKTFKVVRFSVREDIGEIRSREPQ